RRLKAGALPSKQLDPLGRREHLDQRSLPPVAARRGRSDQPGQAASKPRSWQGCDRPLQDLRLLHPRNPSQPTIKTIPGEHLVAPVPGENDFALLALPLLFTPPPSALPSCRRTARRRPPALPPPAAPGRRSPGFHGGRSAI